MTNPALERAFLAARSKPFSIGLAPVGFEHWIEPDELRSSELQLKAEIFATAGRDAFDALPGSEPAQEEVAERLSAHMRGYFPDLPVSSYRSGEPQLLAISRIVQEDLLLLSRGSAGWTLVAGSLCFPSTWRLQDKIGRPMDLIHASVPGFPGRFSDLVARIFDHLQPDALVERHNLSIYADGHLRHDARKEAERFPADASVAELAHLRFERQTLLRLPLSGAILFTVRVRALRAADLAKDPEGVDLHSAVFRHLKQMTDAQWAYKSLTDARERVLEAFEKLPSAP